jgi:hypothetical protein
MDNTQKLELKIQALRESLANKTAQYEDQIADLRVEVTLREQQLQEVYKQLKDAQEKDVDGDSESEEG